MVGTTAVLNIAAGFGLLASSYGWYVENKIDKNQHYKPVCDISDHISCSKPIKSKYAKLLGVPNASLGVGFYSAVPILAVLKCNKLLLGGSALSLLFSAYGGYVSYKLKTLCPVCCVSHLANIALFVASYQRACCGAP